MNVIEHYQLGQHRICLKEGEIKKKSLHLLVHEFLSCPKISGELYWRWN